MARLNSLPPLGNPVTKKGILAALSKGGAPFVSSAVAGSPNADTINTLVDALNTLGLVAIWTPDVLFGGGEAGAWWDISDLGSLFQDSAGTIPAAVDSPVGRVVDKSGHGVDLIQAASSQQPILRSSGGLYWLEADGVDDTMRGTLPASMTPPATLGLSFQFTTTTGSPGPDIFDTGDGSTQTTRNQIGIRSGSLTTYAGGGLQIFGPTEDTADHIAIAVYNGSQSSIQQDTGAVVNGPLEGGFPSAGHEVSIFNMVGTSMTEPMTGRFYGGAYVDRLLTAEEATHLRTWLGGKAGLIF